MNHFLPFSGDLFDDPAVWAIVMVAFCVKIAQTFLYIRQVGQFKALLAWSGFLCILSIGLYCIYDADLRARRAHADRLIDFASTCATGVMGMEHARIRVGTTEDDSVRTNLLDRLFELQMKNKLVASVYTLRKTADGQVIVLLAPSADLNDNGRIDLEPDENGFVREGPIAPGTPFGGLDETTVDALYAGKSWFSDVPVHDDWGSWMTAATPLYDGAGKVEGILCVDFRQKAWDADIRRSRLWPTAFFGLFVAFYLLCVSLYAVLYGSGQKSKRNAIVLEQTVRELIQAREEAEKNEQSNIAQAAEIKRRDQSLIALSRNPAFLGGGGEEAFREIAKLCATTLAAARTGVWLLDKGKLVNRTMYALASNAFSIEPPFPADTFPVYYKMLHTERNIRISDTETNTILPGLAQNYSNVGIRALIDCPIRLSGELVGVLCVEHAGSPREWSLEDQIFGASLADFAAIVIETGRRRESQRQMQTLISNLPGMAFRCRNLPDGFIMEFVSEGLSEITGYDADDLVENKRISFFDLIHPDDRKEFLGAAASTLQVGQAIEMVYRMIHKDGSVHWVWERSRIVEVDPEKPNSSISEGFITDITDRRRLENEAEAAGRAKRDFLSNISHEIRTPMNGVLGLIEMLSKTKLDEMQSQYLDMTRQSARNLLVLINDILDFTKIEAGNLEIELREFDLSAMIEHLGEEFGPSIREKGLRFDVRTEGLPQALIVGDEARLHKVVSHLLDNARKFTETGGISLRVRAHTGTDSTCRCRFEVEDTGPGIAEEQQRSMFGLFTQADTSLTRQHGGTGMGLTICQKMVELFGGEIGVDSRLGRGSTFWFSVTFFLANPSATSQSPGNAVPTSSIPPFDILLVEDVRINQVVASAMIRSLGCRVDVADNGVRALDALRTKAFDLVLMDCQMPEMDGYQCTKILRTSGNDVLNPAIPVIALTAHAMSGDREKCLEAGMDDYLTKPIDAEQLRTAILRWGGKQGKR